MSTGVLQGYRSTVSLLSGAIQVYRGTGVQHGFRCSTGVHAYWSGTAILAYINSTGV